MGEEAIPNSIYIASDLLKGIFLRLPLEPLVRFKTVSKEWRSILESKCFIDMHLRFQKSGKTRRKILAAHHCDCVGPPSLLPGSQFEGGEEFVYLRCDTTRPSLSCDGLVCLPEPGWVNVLNPSTGQLRRFPSGPDPVSSLQTPHHECPFRTGHYSRYFPGYWAMGFGRDKVSGRYKVVRLFFDPTHCEILDVNIGEWRKLLNPPPFSVHVGRKSVYVNGSIYWFDITPRRKILALDLHTEEFHDVSMPTGVTWYKLDTQIVNFEDRLAIVTAGVLGHSQWVLEIWRMDAEEEKWTRDVPLSLADLGLEPWQALWFTPVTVSKQGNILIYDSNKRVYKFYRHTNTVRQIFPHTCSILSPHLENLVRFETDQVVLRANIPCFCEDKVASDRVLSSFQSTVNEFLCEGLGFWLWRNKVKMIATCFLVHLLCCFCISDRSSSVKGVLLEVLDDIGRFVIMILLSKFMMLLPF